MKKKILIFCFFGHIGYSLSKYLSSKNYNVIATYNKSKNNKMFVGELLDRNSTSQQVNFFPNTKFMGCEKDNRTMKDYIDYLNSNISKYELDIN